MNPIRIGFAPTRRSIFSAPDAVKYRGLTADRLRELDVDFVDIDDINAEGLLYDENDRLHILDKFRAAGVDGLFLPHCNFGTEYLCARLAKDLNVPVLLWGPLDERPEPDGTRLRDTQCGLFATGKVLRRCRKCACRTAALAPPIWAAGWKHPSRCTPFWATATARCWARAAAAPANSKRPTAPEVPS